LTCSAGAPANPLPCVGDRVHSGRDMVPTTKSGRRRPHEL
jgi:hypothetical protein